MELRATFFFMSLTENYVLFSADKLYFLLYYKESNWL